MTGFRDNGAVQVRFLLGPAGTGKTFRCLEEIRAELKRSPAGAPLLCLAPKQATFQIERQLLAAPDLAGYTRLQILSFDRLAGFILESLGGPVPDLLGEEGRVMVLRALLAEKFSELRIFRATARLPGFAQQLSAVLRDLQHQQLSPDRLFTVAQDSRAPALLRDKLHDVALIFAAYRDWLARHELHDANSLLDLAVTALRRTDRDAAPLGIGGLWLDGFAEMTPQEQALLCAVLPSCADATLAFCLEAEPGAEERSWLSLWSVVNQTYRGVRSGVEALPGVSAFVEVLPRDAARGRFADSPVLAHLEAHWADPRPFPGMNQETLRVITCADVEAEAVFAAREILRLVRDEGARFRDCAVLMRSLDGYHDTVRRVFTRYGIPFFLDRRELVTHHPLAELTRFALRVAAYGWRRDDWFGVLKSGLIDDDEHALDQLENEALRHGWEQAQWNTTLPLQEGVAHRFESLRARITPPFAKLARVLAEPVSGPQLATIVRGLWAELEVETKLLAWSEEGKTLAPVAASVHAGVQEQMEEWLENVERAFRGQAFPLVEWLPILEAGLAGLSVGVIPPALDQVLVGTIDRSRNPDLKLALVLGLNETVFPAPPPPPPILTETERELFATALARGRHPLGLTRRLRLAHERYYGYIALTRARERLVLTCAAADAKGRALNPSPFLGQVEALFHGLQERRETFSAPDWRDAEHATEIAAPLIDGQHAALAPLAVLPEFAELVARANGLKASTDAGKLASELVARLYQNPYRTSVSALENFAACPFKFFVKSGLGLKEREEFEVDARERGSFQHDILSEFHERATRDGKNWRDLTPADARTLVRIIGEEKLRTFKDGLFAVDETRRFEAETLVQNLERLVETLVGWMAHYQFNPRAVELSFGLPESALPGWKIDLGSGRSLILGGRVDRIDLYEGEGAAEALAVVMDYKSSARSLDATKLHHGLELQLLSYLGWLQQLPANPWSAARLVPAGVFYVGLRSTPSSADSRADALKDAEMEQRQPFQHSGRFDKRRTAEFDRAENHEQFRWHGRSGNACEPETFRALVQDVEQHLKNFGNQILNGVIDIAPYRKGTEVACDRCEFQGICRFDSWTQPYRTLSPPPKTESTPKVKKIKEPKPA